jgi:hypothetical protein
LILLAIPGIPLFPYLILNMSFYFTPTKKSFQRRVDLFRNEADDFLMTTDSFSPGPETKFLSLAFIFEIRAKKARWPRNRMTMA